MNYYNEIKNKLIDDEIYSKMKDYSKERHKVITYFEIGKLLNEAGGKYGDNIIDEYSKKLVIEVGKKYNKRTLFRMKQFYNVFSNERVSTLWTQLTWSHLRLLFNLEIDSMNYYIKVTINKNLSVRELEFKIKSNEYERLPIETKNKLIINKSLDIKDTIPEAIIIPNSELKEEINEKYLQSIIVNNIETFMKQLGEGYSYINREYKIKIGNKYNYIDILLFNIKFNCYVVVELKVTELRKEYLGQIKIYMNHIDEHLKTNSHNKTIGILLVKENNEYALYSSDGNIIIRDFKLI